MFGIMKRDLNIGPENPEMIYSEALSMANERRQINLALHTTGAVLSGLLVILLICLFLWQRESMKRPSLRLIFLASLYDFSYCLLQLIVFTGRYSLNCNAQLFFSGFFTYVIVFTVTSIAVNIHIVFLKPVWTVPPKYMGILLIVAPIIASTIFQAPQIIWASANGYCEAFEAIDQTKPSYMAYVWLVYILPPLVCVSYSIGVCVTVAVTLIREQKKINKVLNEIPMKTSSMLESSNGSMSKSSDSMLQSEKRLKAVKSVYNAAFRISLYPVTPLFSLAMQIAFYCMQYRLTMTWKSDAKKFSTMLTTSWLSTPVIAWFNFIVFMTDPSVHKYTTMVCNMLKEECRKRSQRIVPANTDHADIAQFSTVEYSPTPSPDFSLEDGTIAQSTHIEERVFLLSRRSSTCNDPSEIVNCL